MFEQPQNARFFAAMRVVQKHAKSVLFPATIVMSRYRGTYEGARWLAFPIGAEQRRMTRWRTFRQDWRQDWT